MKARSVSTVDEYLGELPEDRRAIVAKVRKLVLKHLPKGYRETVSWGMISYEAGGSSAEGDRANHRGRPA